MRFNYNYMYYVSACVKLFVLKPQIFCVRFLLTIYDIKSSEIIREVTLRHVQHLPIQL